MVVATRTLPKEMQEMVAAKHSKDHVIFEMIEYGKLTQE
jgi:hypothetical protein